MQMSTFFFGAAIYNSDKKYQHTAASRQKQQFEANLIEAIQNI
jgi:hypothetical protein